MPVTFGRPSSDLVAMAALAGAMLLWSSAFIFAKVALEAFHPVFMLFCRMLGSSVLLLPFLARRARGLPRRRSHLGILALLVLAEPCLYFVFEGYALRYTTASQAGMIVAILPLAVATGAWMVLGERPAPRVWAGFLLAFAGVGMLAFSGRETPAAPDPLLGNCLELCAVLMAAIYTVCVRSLAVYPPFVLVGIQVAGGTLFFGTLLFCLPGDVLPDRFPLLPVCSLLALCGITVFGYGLYNEGVRRLTAARAAAWHNLVPVLTVAFGFAVLGERFTLLQYAALLPIAAGLALSQTRSPAVRGAACRPRR